MADEQEKKENMEASETETDANNEEAPEEAPDKSIEELVADANSGDEEATASLDSMLNEMQEGFNELAATGARRRMAFFEKDKPGTEMPVGRALAWIALQLNITKKQLAASKVRKGVKTYPNLQKCINALSRSWRGQDDGKGTGAEVDILDSRGNPFPRPQYDEEGNRIKNDTRTRIFDKPNWSKHKVRVL